MGEVVVLAVGEDCRVAGLLQGSITYAGMPHEGAYSIVHKKEIGGQYAYNLFYPRYVRNFAIGGISFIIEDVNPEQITFQMEQATLNETRRSVPASAHA